MAKQGLTKSRFKDQIGLKLERTCREEKGEKREEEEEEEEGEEIKPRKLKVWNLTLIMNPMRFGMNIWFCRIIIFPKLGVLLGFHLNPKMIASKVGKTPYDTRSS